MMTCIGYFVVALTLQFVLSACERPANPARPVQARPQTAGQSTMAIAQARAAGGAALSAPALTGTVAAFAASIDVMGASHDRLDFARALQVVASTHIPYATRLEKAVYFGTYATSVLQITAVFAELITNAQRGFEYQRALVGLADPLIRRFGRHAEALALLEQALADAPSLRMQSAIYALQAVAYGKQGDWERCRRAALEDVTRARQIGPAEPDAALTTLAVAYACQGDLAQARETITQAAAVETPGTLPHLLLQALNAREEGKPHRAFEEFLF